MEKRHKACKIALVRDLSYPDLRLWNNAVSIYQKYLKNLQVSYWSEPGFIKDYFNFKNILYDLRNGPVLSPPPAIFTNFRTNTFQKSRSLNKFKLKIKIRKVIDCTYLKYDIHS